MLLPRLPEFQRPSEEMKQFLAKFSLAFLFGGTAVTPIEHRTHTTSKYSKSVAEPHFRKVPVFN